MEWWELLKEAELAQASVRAPSSRHGLLVSITHIWEWKLKVFCPETILENWLLWMLYEWHMRLWTGNMKTSVSQKTPSMHIYHMLAHLGHNSAKLGNRMNSCNILFRAEDQVCLILSLCWVSKWGQKVIQGFRKCLNIFWQRSVREFRQVI